mgnify:CR=1 FL=1
MSGFFIDIEHEQAVVSMGGVQKQVPLAQRDGLLFAKVAGGYVQLRHDGSTSKPGMQLLFMSWDGPLHVTQLGELCLPDRSESKPIANDTPLLGHLT